jgi:tRNA(Arg) A34 adenosine deaminase TadA
VTSPPNDQTIDASRASLTIDIPAWAWAPAGSVFPTVDERMEVVIDLASRNISEGGGPFGAAVFAEDGTFIAPGINRVVLASVPIAHAEIVAIGLAAQALGSWDVATHGSFELVTSTEPCAMCLGAVPWAGVDRLVCGARDSDARTVGFDEGHKPTDWVSALRAAGIDVELDVLRDRAVELLQGYASGGGAIYNGRS